MTISIAKGSFSGDAVAAPQLTMSEDSVTDLDGSPARPTASADDDEHDLEKATPEDKHVLGIRVGESSRSTLEPTTRSRDQVLELNNPLDLADSSAIFSRLNNQNCSPEPPSSRLSNRRSPSDSPPRLSPNASGKSRGPLIRRPSDNEIRHDPPPPVPLRRGEFLCYLYSFAILGTTLRLFVGRLFGSDCEFPGIVEDFLTPLSQSICVTSSGKTLQHGGGLFTDLPSNMLGSFIMGLVSSFYPEGGRYGSKFPWLQKQHPLQRHDGIHNAIKTGLCGSLTTFSSWNTQMVAMMDGTHTELGPQVVSAFFGYVIGMACAAWAFTAGGRVHEWLYDWRNGIQEDHEIEKPSSSSSVHEDEEAAPPTSWDSEESSPRISTVEADELPRPQAQLPPRLRSLNDTMEGSTCVAVYMHTLIPLFITLLVLVAYGLTVTESNAQFYRELCACALLTPIGVHLRWKLSVLNGKGLGSNHSYAWLPWGTLTGNLLAVVVSVFMHALQMMYIVRGDGGDPYILALMVGVKTGAAGALSTVSSFAKETVNLAALHPTHAKAYLYSAGTITASMLLGLAIYSPMMRYG